MFEELKEQYRLSLPDKVSAIKTLLQDIRAGKMEADAQLRVIAHSLHGSGSTLGYPQISSAAKAVEHASAEDMLKELTNLIRVLVSAANNEIMAPQPDSLSDIPVTSTAVPQFANKQTLAPVLIAEDDDLMVSVIRHLLLGEGLKVEYVNNGAAALAALAKQQFSLLILDVKMPLMDGFEALTRIRTTRSKNDFPVIMLTALSSEKDVARGYDLGANDYIAKPFSPPDLLAKIKSQLNIE